MRAPPVQPESRQARSGPGVDKAGGRTRWPTAGRMLTSLSLANCDVPTRRDPRNIPLNVRRPGFGARLLGCILVPGTPSHAPPHRKSRQAAPSAKAPSYSGGNAPPLPPLESLAVLGEVDGASPRHRPPPDGLSSVDGREILLGRGVDATVGRCRAQGLGEAGSFRRGQEREVLEGSGGGIRLGVAATVLANHRRGLFGGQFPWLLPRTWRRRKD